MPQVDLKMTSWRGSWGALGVMSWQRFSQDPPRTLKVTKNTSKCTQQAPQLTKNGLELDPTCFKPYAKMLPTSFDAFRANSTLPSQRRETSCPISTSSQLSRTQIGVRKRNPHIVYAHIARAFANANWWMHKQYSKFESDFSKFSYKIETSKISQISLSQLQLSQFSAKS